MYATWRLGSRFIVVSVALLLMAGCAQAAPPAPAQPAAPGAAAPKVSYPTKTITITVPGAAGGGGDILARQLAEASKASFTQPIVILNQPGAGGQISLGEGAGKSDGHTIVHVSRSIITLNPYIAETKYDYTNFKAILRVQIDPTYIAVPANSRFKGIEEVVKYAQDSPGKLRVVGGEVGSVEFLIGRLLGNQAKITYEYVPFLGGSNVGLDLAGQHADIGLINASDTLQLIESGKIKLLVVARAERTSVFKDVPTLKEKGFDVGDQDQWRGFIVAKEAPDAVVDILHTAFKKAIDTPAFQEYQKGSGMLPGYLGPAEFQKLLADQSEIAKKLYGELGLLKRK